MYNKQLRIKQSWKLIFKKYDKSCFNTKIFQILYTCSEHVQNVKKNIYNSSKQNKKKKPYNDQLIGLSLNLEKRKRSLRDIKPKLKKQHRHNIQVTGMEQ